MKISQFSSCERSKIYQICGALDLQSIHDDSEFYEFVAKVLDKIQSMRHAVRNVKEIVAGVK